MTPTERITNEQVLDRQPSLSQTIYLDRKYLLCVGVRANLRFRLGPCATPLFYIHLLRFVSYPFVTFCFTYALDFFRSICLCVIIVSLVSRRGSLEHRIMEAAKSWTFLIKWSLNIFGDF